MVPRHAGKRPDRLGGAACRGRHRSSWPPLLTLDGVTGETLADQHAASGSAGDVFMLWQYPMRSGKAFGWPGRLIAFVSGIAFAWCCVSGLLLWRRKFKARRP